MEMITTATEDITISSNSSNNSTNSSSSSSHDNNTQPNGLTTTQKTLVKAWWKKVTATNKLENKPVTTQDKTVFGLPLSQSIQYAYSTISYHDDITNTPCMAVIPTIVAKCGSYLKEQGLTVEGIFRLSGSSKRIGQLQSLFDTPEHQYGVYLGWDGFNVHDAANVMRRFLNHLPEPVIPLLYHQQFKTTMETDFTSIDAKIQAFQNLIDQMPLVHQFLLLYLLDLLSLFALTSHLTRMDIPCLASVFAPGILSHPDDALNPSGYKESQLVLEYLIENQNRFRMPSSRIPFVKSECPLRSLPHSPIMQHSISSPADMIVSSSSSNSNNNNNSNIHPLYSSTSSSMTSTLLDTKSMTSLPLSSSPSFYNNHHHPLATKSMVQVNQQPTSLYPEPSISSTSTSSSSSIRRNKTLPSKSTSSSFLQSLQQSNKPSWLDRSTTNSNIKRERQLSMPMTNQKPAVRRWKSIRTVPTMERGDLNTPISTQ